MTIKAGKRDKTYNKGMRVYGVYKLQKYPDWDIVVTDFKTYDNGTYTVQGLAFDKYGRFETIVELMMSRIEECPKEIGYVYKPQEKPRLRLLKVDTESK